MIAPGQDVNGAHQRARATAAADPAVGAKSGAKPRPSWRLRAVAIACLLPCGAWALWPLRSAPLPSIAPVHHEEPTDRAASPMQVLDPAAFRAPLWVVEPPPPEPPPPPPPPPPLKLQLLAIVREDGELRAAIYDPESDRLYSVGQGEPVGACTVERIDEHSVRLVERERVHTLGLERSDQGGTR